MESRARGPAPLRQGLKRPRTPAGAVAAHHACRGGGGPRNSSARGCGGSASAPARIVRCRSGNQR
ncbi:hypothetical protein E2562_037750 [Oryza meyeriana var. granulata]|uniref:Uncharacterized protein n=1 Tax=Oryza meyeriana var. granulata TaxID=110450 RepID=A0A6G1FGE2_9ORYZ|nr:hypothetical protein E2562_037750 [Oryza meyeriana var. granulata]